MQIPFNCLAALQLEWSDLSPVLFHDCPDRPGDAEPIRLLRTNPDLADGIALVSFRLDLQESSDTFSRSAPWEIHISL